MNSEARNKLSEMHAEILALRRELNRIPSRTPPTQPGMRRLFVSDSNNKTLGYGGITGAVYSATPITTGAPLATAYNPSVPVAITDNGIAYAVDLDNSNAPCLIFNRPVNTDGGNFGNILTFDLPQSCIFLAWRQVGVPVSGGSTIAAWEAYWA